jgi:hypothetical protein
MRPAIRGAALVTARRDCSRKSGRSLDKQLKREPRNARDDRKRTLARGCAALRATMPVKSRNYGNMDPQAQEQLQRHRRVWEAKPVLQRIYNEQFFTRLLAVRIAGGVSVEVGAGPGFFKSFAKDAVNLVSTDLIWCPWLDAVVDAHRLPFRTGSVTNVFGLDMLHHLVKPMGFLGEAQRVLVAGGRLILVEPWITPFSYVLFRLFHQERCDLSEMPWVANGASRVNEKREDESPANPKLAFDGNQAIPHLMFGRHRSETLKEVEGLRLHTLEPFCLFAYLLSGGFNHASWLPNSLYSTVAGIERVTAPLWRHFAALRVLLVLERRS